MLAISSIGLSRHLELDHPDLALKFFPLNVEAFLNGASRRFAQGASAGELGDIAHRATRLLSLHPGDARLYSVIGEVERRRGASDRAFAAFGHALALARTEVHALEWRLYRAVLTGNAHETLQRIDALFRRWPDRIGALAPLIAQVFAEPEPYEMLVRRIAAQPPWRTTLISRLAGSEETLGFSAQLLQDLAAEMPTLKVGEISNVLNGLINVDRYELAYRTFLLTLSPVQQEQAGFVYNGRFRLPPTGRPFDWQVRSHPGIGFSYPAADAGGKDAGLRLEFQQAPVRDIRVRQYLHLPAGRYSLRLRVSAAAAILPKGLFWNVRCADSGTLFTQVAMKNGTYRDAELDADLTVPDACPLQLLHLSTNAIAENWNDRYGGVVTFDSVMIVESS